MIKKTITYKDYNGNERTEDFYFNISRSELLTMELMSQEGDEIENGAASSAFARRLTEIQNSKSGRRIMGAFKEIIRDAYGERTPDGKSFLKSAEISANFEGTGAYDILFTELITDAAKAADFIRGLVPPDIAADPIIASQPLLDSAEIDRETQSRLAREASEAALQGHRKKADHEASGIVEVPSIPTVNTDETPAEGTDEDKAEVRRRLQEQLAALGD